MKEVWKSGQSWNKWGLYKRLVGFCKSDWRDSRGETTEYKCLRRSCIVYIWIDKMLQDVLPKDELLVATMIAKFWENQEFIASFVAKTLREGNKISNVENTKQT